jgi:hypothetical protein
MAENWTGSEYFDESRKCKFSIKPVKRFMVNVEIPFMIYHDLTIWSQSGKLA